MKAQDLEVYSLCPRRWKWTTTFIPNRVSTVGALYQAVHAGLTGHGEKAAKDKLMEVAGMPGLDVQERPYDTAVHLSFLAGIIVSYLRGKDEPWKVVRARTDWDSSCYENPDGSIRRIVLCDYWSEDRALEERVSWRTIGEICALNRPMLINAISIGRTVMGRRVSPWTRCYSHPRNRGIRFKRGKGEFAESWSQVWRENWSGTTDQWLGWMQSDGVFDDLVHSMRVEVPARREEFLDEMERMADEMNSLPEDPPMLRSGCFRNGKCVYLSVCHGEKRVTPGSLGHIRYSDLG